MTLALEHFFIRKDWGAFYAGVEKTYEFFTLVNIENPQDGANRKIFETVNDRIRFLENLLGEQQLTVPGINERIGKISNTMTSLLSLYEDNEIRLIKPARMAEIYSACNETFTKVLNAISDKKHKTTSDIADAPPVEAAPEPIPITMPVLDKNSSFDNLRDAMRVLLSQAMSQDAPADLRQRTEEVVLSPEQRLFKNIEMHQNNSITNFATAIRQSLESSTIQFADGMLAIQGLFNKKDLVDIPHLFVQIKNMRISRASSDTMTPTIFLYGQRFAVFPYFKTPDGKPDHEKTAMIIQRAEERMGRPSFLDPFQTARFPKYRFLWFPTPGLVEQLNLRPNLTAELSV